MAKIHSKPLQPFSSYLLFLKHTSQSLLFQWLVIKFSTKMEQIINKLIPCFIFFALCPASTTSNTHGGEAHSRQKRFIYFNTQTPVDVGLIITLPISFALPTFNLKTSRRFRRDNGEAGKMDTWDNYLQNMTSEDLLPEGSYDDVAYNQELNKLSLYFNVLEIKEDICQQRILCEIFADEENFRPVTDLFKRKLTVDRGPVPEKHTNRYFRYVQAMQDGLVNGDSSKCQKLYHRCPYSSADRLHLASLRFWTFLSSALHLEFRDD